MNNANEEDNISKFLETDSTAVQSYLNILQSIINRMANNSSNCKTWCITIVSAIIIVIADKVKPNYMWIALFPIIMFLMLDAYYLGQERSFRQIYNNFIERIQSNSATINDLYIIFPMKGKNIFQSTLKAVTSFSIYPFYITLLILLIVGRYFIFK